jgi:putative DNA primase/helicase
MKTFEKFDSSKINWMEAFARLGVEEQYLVAPKKSKKCPLHPNAGKTKFRFLDPVERGIWACNDCGYGNPVTLVMRLHGWDFKQFIRALEDGGMHRSVSPVAQAKENPSAALKRANRARRDYAKMRALWRAAAPVALDNPAGRYLKRRIKGLQLHSLGADVRAHPGVPYYEEDDKGTMKLLGHFPALIALFRDGEGKIRMMHRIYVTDTGEKAPVDVQKKMLVPEWVSGCSIRIGGDEGAAVIGVAEGVEKACAIYTACNGKFPVLVAGSAHGMESLTIPSGVKKLHIFADHNYATAAHPLGVSQQAAQTLKSRAQAQGVEAIIHVAKTPGGDHEDDWNTMRAETALA